MTVKPAGSSPVQQGPNLEQAQESGASAQIPEHRTSVETEPAIARRNITQEDRGRRVGESRIEGEARRAALEETLPRFSNYNEPTRSRGRDEVRQILRQQAQASAAPEHPRRGTMAPEHEVVRRNVRENQEPTSNRQGTLSNLDGTERMNRPPETPETIDVTRDPSFEALPEATRNRLTQAISANPRTSDELQQVVNHPLYDQLTPESRTRLLNVFEHSDSRGRESLPALMGRRVVIGSGDPPPSRPALLSEDNTTNRTTLLDNLDRMATQPLHESLANRRSELMGRVIQETAEPTWRVDQGSIGTCAPTTIQHHLLRHSPSEYARILGGLSGPNRNVTLANGSRMSAAQNDTANPATVLSGNPPAINPDPRSLTERMFQSAVMQHAGRANPPIGRGPNYNLNVNTHPGGMWDDATAYVMRGLYNRDYSFHPPGARGISHTTGNHAEMRRQLYAEVRREIHGGQGPIPVHLVWGGGDLHGLHEVSVERIENGRVYFRNPWGSRDPGSGQLPDYNDGLNIGGPPPRRVEDGQSGLESMTVQDFRNVLNGATIGPPVGG